MEKTISNKTYSEVYEIIEIMGEEYKRRVPETLYKMIEAGKSEEFMHNYKTYQDIDMKKLDKDTLSMLALLHVNYWCDTEDEKNEIRKILNENENKAEMAKKEKYKDPFEKKEKMVTTKEENVSIKKQEEKQSFIKKFFSVFLKHSKKN